MSFSGRFFGIAAGWIVLMGLATGGGTAAQAGVFGIPHFVEQGNFAVGIEPELTLSDDAGLGVNAKFIYGLTELNNVQAIIGTGGGGRRFRAGGNITFDFFPDIEGQPGIGIAAQGIYYRYLGGTGAMELSAIPYLHKAFRSGESEVEPYVAVPFGVNLLSGDVMGTTSVAVGSYFMPESAGKIRYGVELGVNVSNAATYLSAGLLYYY